ncbi:5,6-dimethylbenzimidazole synthase [Thermoactinomyces mirandus]|uniref:5,6-dimethylbenzimidazole synthase n=1 Tax=Thermoactinomyces mirandus TaxID=2756294 RepID=A0A7W2ATI0_9BACL|nr:5,6-dimethylbenzimidazole synthase [Thermoactinomyces mirandus]MBA4603770.1 5,6-dimethylbenzimidazole synthase [Thermoactinomyces mirandus]
MSETFSKTEQEVIYRVIRARRDIRHFQRNPVPEDALARILEAAHFAPSVGFMQPWNFIFVSSLTLRQQIKNQFIETNKKQLEQISEPERQKLYRELKLEGIMEAPVNLAVTCDRNRDAPFVLGRGPMPETDLFSTCLAIENMWLAARAEGIGIGWISILNREKVGELLKLPVGVRLVAYLCIGYPVEFRTRPLLEEVGWKSRLDLSQMVFENEWGNHMKWSSQE